MIFESGNKTLSKFGFPKWEEIHKQCRVESLHRKQEENNMKIPVEKSLKLTDGEYEGVIEDIKYRNEPYNYTDIVIKVKDSTMTVGYPTKIVEDSALGKLLIKFGAVLTIGKDIEPEEFLTKGTNVKFTVINQVSKKDGNTYCNIVKETLRKA